MPKLMPRRAIEDTNEEAKRHYGAAEQDGQGRPRGEKEIGSKDGEGKDEPRATW